MRGTGLMTGWVAVVFGVLGALGVLSAGGASKADAAERAWQARELGGGRRYVVEHGESSGFVVDVISERAGRLPYKVESHRFAHEAEAARYAAKYASRLDHASAMEPQ